MYKLTKPAIEGKKPSCILTVDGLTAIPCNLDNTDYTRFKKEINEETAELQDADGNTMTSAEAKAYVATLP